MLNPYAKAFFKKTARHLWRDLGKRHKHGLNKGETGITDDIIYLLSRYVRKHPWSGIKVWQSKDEAHNGHDIDLFIKGSEKHSGYYWFPLQAKVLHNTKQYNHANHANPNGEQWALLNALQSKATKKGGVFCDPHYLLYNGFSAKCRARYLRAYNPTPRTIAAAWRRSLGCSLVEVDEFHKISAPTPPANTNKPLYHELHNESTLAPNGPVFPWHHLFKPKMRLTKRRGVRLLSETELQNRLAFYQNVVMPLKERVDPVSYYYYHDFDGLFADEAGSLRGRYAVVISAADDIGRLFSVM